MLKFQNLKLSVAWAANALLLANLLVPSLGLAAEETAPAPSAAPLAPHAAPEVPPSRSLKAQRELQQFKLLTKQLGTDKVISLEADGEKFIAVWEPDTSGQPQGTVLMLHDVGRTLDWPSSLQNLRQYLSQHGWATLSIALPDPNDPVPVARPDLSSAPAPTPPAASESTAAQGKSNEPAESQVVFNDAQGTLGDGSLAAAKTAAKPPSVPPPAVEPIATARIQAALTYLNAQNQYNNVLLGEGLGAARAAYFMLTGAAGGSPDADSAAPAKPFRGLVLIHAHHQIPERLDFNLLQIFVDPSLPLLDVDYPVPDAALSPASLRAKAARKAGFKIYEQQIITEPLDSDAGENRVSRLVRGFLVRNLGGKLVHKH